MLQFKGWGSGGDPHSCLSYSFAFVQRSQSLPECRARRAIGEQLGPPVRFDRLTCHLLLMHVVLKDLPARLVWHCDLCQGCVWGCFTWKRVSFHVHCRTIGMFRRAHNWLKSGKIMPAPAMQISLQTQHTLATCWQLPALDKRGTLTHGMLISRQAHIIGGAVL